MARALAERREPESHSNLRTFDCGLLSPEGKFYHCYSWGHDDLAWSLGFDSSWDAQKRGWIRFTGDESCDPTNTLGPEARVTQRQVDAIFDWVQCAAWRKMPEWVADTEIR